MSPSNNTLTVDDRITRLVPYHPGKPISEVRRELGLTEIVKLASNENPLGPSPKAIDAIIAAAASVHVYPDGACHDLRTSIAARLDISPDSLVFGNGSDEIIHLLGLTYLCAGDEVVVAHPTFSRYESAAVLAGAHTLRVPLRDWAFDIEAMVASITDRTRLVFLSNPNNPTGGYASTDGVNRLIDSLPDRCILCIDEAYYEYAARRDYPQAIEYVRQNRNVIILRTFSKIYGLAGLRIGYGIAKRQIIGHIEQVREPFNTNALAQTAAVAALDDSAHLEASRSLVLEQRPMLARRLSEMDMTVYPSEGNFLWVNTHRDSQWIFDGLLRCGVIVRTGDAFDAPGYLRITIGTAQQNEKLLSALSEVLSKP